MLNKKIVSYLLYLLLIVILSFLIITFVGQRTCVDGHSMENTLFSGDNLIIDKISYYFKTPKRFEIVVFPHKCENGTKYYIKRIIGLPGETVFIDASGEIYIDNKPLKESYGKEIIHDAGLASTPIALGSDEYFVLGDNRNNSSDSRDSSVGLISSDQIIGRVFVRVFPFSKIGFLNS